MNLNINDLPFTSSDESDASSINFNDHLMHVEDHAEEIHRLAEYSESDVQLCDYYMDTYISLMTPIYAIIDALTLPGTRTIGLEADRFVTIREY